MKLGISKSDAYLIAIFYVIAIPVSLIGYNFRKGWFEPVGDTLNYIFFSAFVAYFIVYKFFPYFFPQKRIIGLFVSVCILMSICGAIEIFIYEWIDNDHWKFLKKFGNSLNWWVYGISSSAENAGILVGVLLGKKFYDAQLELQQRETEKKENELRLLKSQIDPHFLFNNLNSVDALIDHKPEVAKAYLQKLAQLYRYLIRTKDDEVVLLEEELEFARNYIFLLEQRYGKAYIFEIEGNSHIERMILPGALQTLLENVVKHNVGTISEPVNTSIIIELDQIIVSNNIIEKNRKFKTTSTGLANLKVRYGLLSDSKMMIAKDDNFTVSLPLLKEVV